MQNILQSNHTLDKVSSPNWNGTYCSSTKRVVVISPYPALLHELVSELMTRCYDILMFHNAKEPILPIFQNDIIVVDHSWGIDQMSVDEGLTSDCLYLIGDKTTSPTLMKHRLTWPNKIDAVIAKIEELVGQKKLILSPQSIANRLHFKDVEMDLKRMIVLHRGIKIDLTKTEFDLLRLLMLNEGVMTRQEIMESLWGDEFFGGSNSIDVFFIAFI